MIKLLYPHSAMLGSLFYSFVGYNSVKLRVEQRARSHDLSLTDPHVFVFHWRLRKGNQASRV